MPRDLFAEAGINPNAPSNVPEGAPRDLFAEYNITPQTANPGIINRIVNSAPNQLILGAGDAARNEMAKGINTLFGTHLGQFTAPGAIPGATSYNVGSFVGSQVPYLMGGEGLDAARAAAEGLPLLGSAARYLGQSGLPSALNRMAGNAVYGALTNPGNSQAGALKGAALSGATELIPGGGAWSALYNKFSPTPVAENIANSLSSGQNMKDLVNSTLLGIRNVAYPKRVNNVNLYNNLFDNLPAGGLFKGVKRNLNYFKGFPKQSEAVLQPSQMSPATKQAVANFEALPWDVEQMHKNFNNVPSFPNAHWLHSELGSAINDIASNINSSQGDKQVMKYMIGMKNNLKKDMDNYLSKLPQDQQDQYAAATRDYKKNVVPFNASSNLRSITRASHFGVNPDGSVALSGLNENGMPIDPEIGKTVSLDSSLLPNLFRSSKPETQGTLDKAIAQMPDSIKDNLLYAKLGQTADALEPEKLWRNFQKVQNKNYITPGAQGMFNELGNRVQNMNMLEKGAGALAGLGLGGGLGMHLGDAGGALAGVIGAAEGLRHAHQIATLGAKGLNALRNTAIGKLAIKSAPHVKNALLANLIPGGQ